ncbi:MAG TPA: sigma-70 family RNA polymerase sigma factor [Bacteroides sp.]|nr:sigma-70 family RNA polymerase sigma factor [Bacteroides sp.]
MVKEPAYPNIHQDLIDKCKEGNRETQFRIYGLYYKSMYNTSLRIVKDPGEAEDIMQESFLSAFEKIDTYAGTVSFGSWLKKIVVNRSLDSIKKKRLYFETLDEKITGDLREDNGSAEISVDIDRIRDSIMKLPDGFRIVLSLYLLEGYDHEEIGQILNISSSTSRSQFTRAKQKLIELLKGNE